MRLDSRFRPVRQPSLRISTTKTTENGDVEPDKETPAKCQTVDASTSPLPHTKSSLYGLTSAMMTPSVSANHDSSTTSWWSRKGVNFVGALFVHSIAFASLFTFPSSLLTTRSDNYLGMTAFLTFSVPFVCAAQLRIPSKIKFLPLIFEQQHVRIAIGCCAISLAFMFASLQHYIGHFGHVIYALLATPGFVLVFRPTIRIFRTTCPLKCASSVLGLSTVLAFLLITFFRDHLLCRVADFERPSDGYAVFGACLLHLVPVAYLSLRSSIDTPGGPPAKLDRRAQYTVVDATEQTPNDVDEGNREEFVLRIPEFNGDQRDDDGDTESRDKSSAGEGGTCSQDETKREDCVEDVKLSIFGTAVLGSPFLAFVSHEDGPVAEDFSKIGQPLTPRNAAPENETENQSPFSLKRSLFESASKVTILVKSNFFIGFYLLAVFLVSFAHIAPFAFLAPCLASPLIGPEQATSLHFFGIFGHFVGGLFYRFLRNQYFSWSAMSAWFVPIVLTAAGIFSFLLHLSASAHFVVLVLVLFLYSVCVSAFSQPFFYDYQLFASSTPQIRRLTKTLISLCHASGLALGLPFCGMSGCQGALFFVGAGLLTSAISLGVYNILLTLASKKQSNCQSTASPDDHRKINNDKDNQRRTV